ncbi:MAG: CapA family protein [Oscillospiraceae bacterium]
MKKLMITILIAIFLLGSFSGCGKAKPTSADANPETTADIKKKEEPKTITLSATGDVTLGTDTAFGGQTMPVELENQNNDYSYFFKNVKSIFEDDDVTLVNFEGTLTNRGARQDKTFAFRADPKYVNILTEGSVEAGNLANNHSYDYGEDSHEDTKKALDEAKILNFGDENVSVSTINDVAVGFVGINTLKGAQEKELPIAMQKVKDQGAELIIVSFHWGVEGSNESVETQKKLAHTAIDSGAHLVIGHHPHVLQGIEKYKGRYIAYSLGNFCFGGNQNPQDKDTMIFRQTFTINEGKVAEDDEYEIIPCSISSTKSRNNYQPTPLNGDDKKRVENKIQKFTNANGKLELKFANSENSSRATEAASTKAPVKASPTATAKSSKTPTTKEPTSSPTRKSSATETPKKSSAKPTPEATKVPQENKSVPIIE